MLPGRAELHTRRRVHHEEVEGQLARQLVQQERRAGFRREHGARALRGLANERRVVGHTRGMHEPAQWPPACGDRPEQRLHRRAIGGVGALRAHRHAALLELADHLPDALVRRAPAHEHQRAGAELREPARRLETKAAEPPVTR